MDPIRMMALAASRGMRIKELEEQNAELLAALKWYVDHDDINIGQDGNEFYEEGYFKAVALLNKAKRTAPLLHLSTKQNGESK